MPQDHEMENETGQRAKTSRRSTITQMILLWMTSSTTRPNTNDELNKHMLEPDRQEHLIHHLTIKGNNLQVAIHSYVQRYFNDGRIPSATIDQLYSEHAPYHPLVGQEGDEI